MSTFVLVHGAWHGSWCWERVVPRLEAAGHTVVAPDLPGHGKDPTPIADVTLARYTDRICEVLDAQTEPVALVGHSMGGIVLTAVAEKRPMKIRVLVYLAAFLTGGESLSSTMAQNPSSLLADGLKVAPDGASATVREDVVIPAFYGRCSPKDAASALSRLVPQALQPVGSEISITMHGAGGLPRVYIECLDDRAVPLELQRRMVATHPCEAVFSVDADHSPFYSAVDELCETLLQV